MDYIYPRAKEGIEKDVIDKKVDAPAMVALIEGGAPAGYSGFKEGDRLSKVDVCSIIQSGRNCSREMADLYDEIEDEKKAMAGVRISNIATQTAYVAELDKVKNHLDSAKWLAGVKAEANVSTWTALKEIYPTVVVEAAK